MAEKKEVTFAVLQENNNNKSTEEEFLNVLRIVAPGTSFRAAIEGALSAGKGALIVVENDNTYPLIEGGFRVNCRFTPQRIVELSKMDGAIIMSRDMKKILQANALLTPDSKIESSETGTRHKAGERTAQQTGSLVVAISERRHEVTLFYKDKRYILKPADHLLRKANENIQLLEKQRELFDKHVEKLNHMEMRNHPSLNQAVAAIQKGRLIEKISEELRKQAIELGNEGTLIKTRLRELIHGVAKETDYLIKDYTKLDLKKSRVILESLSYEGLTDEDNILKLLAHDKISNPALARGWRILSRTGLPEDDLSNIVRNMKSLGRAIHSNIKDISEILDEEKSKLFKEEIAKLKVSIN